METSVLRVLSFFIFPLKPFCVKANAQVQITDVGQANPVMLSASQIGDLILPMPDPLGTGSNLPNVTIQAAQ